MSMNTDFFNAVAQVVDEYKLDRIRFFYDVDEDDCCDKDKDRVVSIFVQLDYAEDDMLDILKDVLSYKLKEIQDIHKYPYRVRVHFGSLCTKNPIENQDSGILQFAKERSQYSSPTGNVFVVE